MPTFNKSSQERLNTCHPDLQRLFNEVIKYFDCTVLCGFRNQKDQDAAYAAGKSEMKWPYGKHNATPSMAVDVAPYNVPNEPVDWDDAIRFYYFGGFVMGMAKVMGIKLRYGGDFNMNTRVKDEKFRDLPHFELLT